MKYPMALLAAMFWGATIYAFVVAPPVAAIPGILAVFCSFAELDILLYNNRQ